MNNKHKINQHKDRMNNNHCRMFKDKIKQHKINHHQESKDRMNNNNRRMVGTQCQMNNNNNNHRMMLINQNK